jgi:hypothetical protein
MGCCTWTEFSFFKRQGYVEEKAMVNWEAGLLGSGNTGLEPLAVS